MKNAEIALHQSSFRILNLLYFFQTFSKPVIKLGFAFKVLKDGLIFKQNISFGLNMLDIGGDKFFVGTYTF